MPEVYILQSLKDYKTYTGSTANFGDRFNQHCLGKVKSTKNRRPLKLIYSEHFDNLHEARQREHYLKSAAGRRFLKEKLKDLIIAG